MAGFRDRTVALKRVKASALTPHPENWRQHPPSQRTALTAMLEDVGIVDALIVRKVGKGYQIIDGHLRADIMGDDTVPVLVVDLSAAEARKVLATLDPLAAMAETSKDQLAALIKDTGLDTMPGIEDLMKAAKVALAPSDGLTDPDAAPEPPKKAKSKPGDLYVLGDHRLLCGDATKAEDVTRLLDGATPNLMITDPPYGVDYDPEWRAVEAAKGNLAFAPRRRGKVAADDRVDWSEAWALSPANVVYVWHAGIHASTVQASLTGAGFEIRAQIIWSKQHFPISRGHYHWRHEPCWYAVRAGATAGWIGDRTQTTVWDINMQIGYYQEPESQKTNHGTQKPVDCMERPLRNHEGDVYDPFIGSGTTIMAAQRLDRRCFALEIDPVYVDVAVKRWQDFTGQRAQRERGGKVTEKHGI